MNVTLEKPKHILQWLQIYLTYLQAFPAEERKPFSLIVRMYRQKKSDIWCICQQGKMKGFASTINSETIILLDYLAIDSSCRGEGIGSKTLSALREKYQGKGLLVEIESPFEEGDDREARIRRKQFYLNSGMQELRVMVELFGVNMELLSWNCSLDFEGYKAFYHDNYSPWAAEHVLPKSYPEQ